MEVTTQQLRAVDARELPPVHRNTLRQAILYTKNREGRAWIHPGVLRDFGIEGNGDEWAGNWPTDETREKVPKGVSADD